MAHRYGDSTGHRSSEGTVHRRNGRCLNCPNYLALDIESAWLCFSGIRTMRDRNWRLLFLPSSYRKLGPRNRPSLLPSYPPARHGFVESRSLLGVELTAAQLVPLRVQPDAEVVRLAGDDRLCNARRYRRPGTPSAPPAVRATAPRPPGPAVFFPSRAGRPDPHGMPAPVCRPRRPCRGAAAIRPRSAPRGPPRSGTDSGPFPGPSRRACACVPSRVRSPGAEFGRRLMGWPQLPIRGAREPRVVTDR
jgi:hypothetical protein